jgi:hypothetical protein
MLAISVADDPIRSRAAWIRAKPVDGFEESPLGREDRLQRTQMIEHEVLGYAPGNRQQPAKSGKSVGGTHRP